MKLSQMMHASQQYLTFNCNDTIVMITLLSSEGSAVTTIGADKKREIDNKEDSRPAYQGCFAMYSSLSNSEQMLLLRSLWYNSLSALHET